MFQAKSDKISQPGIWIRMYMATKTNVLTLRVAFGVAFLLSLCSLSHSRVLAQAPAATANQLGTVKTISGANLTMATDKGAMITVTVADGAKIYELPVGSTDLKAAKPGQVTDIAVGDRALVTGKAGDTPDALTALRVVLMKSADIAQMQADQQADWKARGTGGIVNAIDPSTGVITIASGTKKTVINTSSKTIFRRFAGDSVNYQDAQPGTISQIEPKNQLQARGTKSTDGTSMQAEEVISGSFEDLSGLLVSVDDASGNVTLKDLNTKKMVTVHITANSNIRSMPLQMATQFAARSNGGGQSGGRRGGGGAGAQGAAGGDSAGMRRSAGADLSQMIGRLPSATLADLHKDDAVMIVASQPMGNSNTVTAVTVLTGVDPILTANPNGGMDLSMSLGGGGATGE
jgi:hypothetical protein